MLDEYYWAEHPEGSQYVVKLEAGLWYTVGVGHPINADFDEGRILCAVDDSNLMRQLGAEVH